MKYALYLAIAAMLASGAELHLALHDDAKTLDPFLVADESAETLLYLTEGVLIRVNRLSQQPEAELAQSWKIENNGARIVFHLRPNVRFPDGSAFTSADVVATFHRLLDPALHSPVADTFKTGHGTVQVTAKGANTFPRESPIARRPVLARS
jgi:peptide/nickel transport system substrate-binding protein